MVYFPKDSVVLSEWLITKFKKKKVAICQVLCTEG